MNPFNYTGSDFLAFYAIVIVAASIGVWFVRRMARGGSGMGGGVRPTSPKLDAYETAFLAGGGARATLLAVAALADRGALEIDRDGRSLKPTPAVDRGLHQVERALLNASGGATMSVGETRKALTPPMETIKGTLQRQGLVVTDGDRTFAKAATLLLVGGTLALGVAKVVVGIQRNRPVEFLVMMCFLYLLVSVVILARRPLFRTTAGDALLKQLQHRQPKAAELVGSPMPGGTVPVVPMMVALWGMDALVGYAFYDELQHAFARPTTTGGDGGGSNCSSGGGDGGGDGGGGGGCGGCGGGGD